MPRTKSKDGQERLPGFIREAHRPEGVPNRQHPFVDETGYIWLDVFTGEPPVTDANGRLLQRHHISMAYHPFEPWGVGITLPPTPKAQAELFAQEKDERERSARHVPPARQEAPPPARAKKRANARKAA